MATCLVKIEMQGKTETKVLEGDRFTFGRALDCSVVLQHESISRKHLEIAYRKGKIYLKDLGSSNGTSINGKKMKSEEIREYSSGDIIRIGNSEFAIRLELKSEAQIEHVEEKRSEAKATLPSEPVGAPQFPLGQSKTASPTLAPANITIAPMTANFQESELVLKNAEKKAKELIESAELSIKAKIDAAELVVKTQLEKAEAEAKATLLKSETESKKIIEDAEEAAVASAKVKETEIIRHAEQAARAAATQIHEEARASLENSQLKAKKELDDAREEAESIKAKANAQVAILLDEAKKNSAEVEKTSQSLFLQAKESAEKIISLKRLEAEEEKKELLKKWEREHKTLVQEIKEFSAKIEEKRHQLVSAEAFEKDAQAKLKAKELEVAESEKKRSQAIAAFDEEEKKLDQIQARHKGLERQIEENKKLKEEMMLEIKSLQSKSKNDSEALEKEYVQKKERIQVEMAELRQKEKADIQKLRLDELDNLDRLRRQAVADIQKNQVLFTKGLAEKVEARMIKMMKSSGISPYPELGKEVEELVLEGFDEQIFEIGQSFEKDIRHQVKAETQQRKQSLKKAGGFAVGATLTLALIFIFQGGNLMNAVQGINEAGLTAAEQYSRKMYEDRAGMKFEPTMSPELKASYTDNVLYTQNYLDKVQNSEIREKWIKLLNKFLTRNLALEDDSVVQLVANESTLISRLKAERDQINPEYVEVTVEKMRKLEDESTQKIRHIFKNQVQYERYKKLSRDFWMKEFLETSESERLPANGK